MMYNIVGFCIAKNQKNGGRCVKYVGYFSLYIIMGVGKGTNS